MPRSKNPFAVEESPTNPSDPTTEPTETTEPTNVAVPVDFFTKLLATFADKMNEGIRESVKAAREVPIDPIKQAQKERAAITKKNAEEGYWKNLISRAENCPGNHRRSNMTSAIAWAKQSDNATRGVCQHCFTIFSPYRNECCSDAVYEQYKELVRVPTNTTDSVNYIS